MFRLVNDFVCLYPREDKTSPEPEEAADGAVELLEDLVDAMRGGNAAVKIFQPGPASFAESSS